jgi:lipopolysaccharide heptosyltransferase II
VILLPVLKAVREKYPHADISLLTLKQNRGILAGCPYIDEVLLLDVGHGKDFVLSALRLVSQIRRYRFDWVLDFDQFSRTTAILTALTGAYLRVGLDTFGQRRGYVFSRKVPYNDYQHTALTFADVARAAGVECDPEPTPIPLSPEDDAEAERFLAAHDVTPGDLLVGMHMGTGDNFPGRRWPAERFAELAQQIAQDHGGTVVFTGSASERAMIEAAIGHTTAERMVNSAGELSLKGLCALIRRCRFFVSNDSAPVHIASAMGTPVVAFFGPNTPRLYGPRGVKSLVFYQGLSCSPCITNFNAKTSGCMDPRCMTSITVEEVLRQIKSEFFPEPAPQERESTHDPQPKSRRKNRQSRQGVLFTE